MKHLSLFTSLWLGILTSISPCPLASNIAALSFLSGGAGSLNSKNTIFTGCFYTLGRMIAYSFLAFIITWQILSVPAVANFLQRYMNIVIGPLLILVGILMLDLLHIKIPGFSGNRLIEGVLKRHSALFGALVMGILFALSFCPVSAALFFGSLIPLALRDHSPLVLPLAYGAGTAAPVVAVAIAIGLGVDITGRFYRATNRFGNFAKKATGFIFILVGAYYSWNFLVPFLEGVYVS